MYWLRLLIVVACFLPWGQLASAQTKNFETKAREAILVDLTSDTVLFEKNADEKMPTSSMSKIMTAYMVFEALQDGRLKLSDEFPVSKKAWKKEGSKMFIEVNTKVSVENLLRGMLIQSGNDAAIALAEGLAGTEDIFAEQISNKAIELGMTNSHFMNATGWPVEGHYSTARDLALLAGKIIQTFPEYYHIFSERSFTYNNITQPNRNLLLGRTAGVDGMKTGHTDAAGFGIIISAERDNRRLVLVMNGLHSKKERADEAEKLLEYGFREFQNYSLLKAGEVVTDAQTWLGTQETVPAVVSEDVTLTMHRLNHDKLTANAVLELPIPAPIVKGQQIGKVVFSAPDTEDVSVPLLAGQDVEEAGLFTRMFVAVKTALFGYPTSE